MAESRPPVSVFSPGPAWVREGRVCLCVGGGGGEEWRGGKGLEDYRGEPVEGEAREEGYK